MESIFAEIPKSILSEIEKNNSIVIISHKAPDGDALSSSLALGLIARKLGKEAIILNSGPFQRKELAFLINDILPCAPREFIAKKPLVAIFDCSTIDRLGDAYIGLEDLPTIVIDHHSSGKLFIPEEMSYIVAESPSTTLLIEELRCALGIDLDKELATYLYIGLATDTGFFHFLSDKTGPYAFQKASLFSQYGVNPYEIYDTLNDGKSLDELKTASSLIENSRLFYDGQLAIIYQGKESPYARLSDTIYQQMLTVDGIKAVVFIKTKQEKFELGFRAKRNSGIDVGQIAASIGGGGHRLASGATISNQNGNIISYCVNLFSKIL